MSILEQNSSHQQPSVGTPVQGAFSPAVGKSTHLSNKLSESLPLPDLTLEAQVNKLSEITGITPYATALNFGVGYVPGNIEKMKRVNANQPLYWHPSNFDQATGTDKAGKAVGRVQGSDITATRFIFADFDQHINGSAATASDPVTVDEVMPLFPEGFEPSFIINTGKGVQAFWQLEQEVSVAEFTPDQFKAFHQHLAALLKSDKAVNNIDRMMRLPGSHYRKTDRATKQPVDGYDKLMSFGYISGKRYTLDALMDAFDYEPATPASKPTQADNTGRVIAHPDIVCSLIKAGEQITLSAATERGHSAFTGAIVSVVKALRFYKASSDQLDEAKQRLIDARVERKGEGFREKAESDYADMFEKAINQTPELEPFIAHVSGINELKPANRKEGRSGIHVVKDLFEIIKDQVSFDSATGLFHWLDYSTEDVEVLATELHVAYSAFTEYSNQSVLKRLESDIKKHKTVHSVQLAAQAIEPREDKFVIAELAELLGFKAYDDNPESESTFNLVCTYLERFGAGMVYRWLHPGAQHDEALLLISEKQGAGKNKLIPLFAIDSSLTFEVEDTSKMIREDWLGLGGSCVAYSDEIASKFRKGDHDKMKAAITKRFWKGRRAFGKTMDTVQLTASWIFNSNEKDVLKDKTGNRRYLPILLPKGHRIDTIAVERIKPRYMSHWKHLANIVESEDGKGLRDHERTFIYWFTGDETDQINDRAEEFMYKTGLEDAIMQWRDNEPIAGATATAELNMLEEPHARISPYDWFPQSILARLLLMPLGYVSDLAKDKNAIARALEKAGFERKKFRSTIGNNWFWHCPKPGYLPVDEMKRYLVNQDRSF